VKRLSHHLEDLVDALAASAGVVAVALGGSRATAEFDADSDWDLAVYYRGTPDLGPLARFGEVHPPGSWGRVMNGGAWLSLAGNKVDVLLRDLDVVLYWSALAERGKYEVDALLGYLAGVPTYSLLAERALGITLRGSLPPAGPFTEALARVAPERWRFARRFSLGHARARALQGDAIGAIGQVAKAIIEEAHALLCSQSHWVLNEKRIVERAGLGAMHDLVAGAPRGRDALIDWVASVETALDAA